MANKQDLAERLKFWFIQVRAGMHTDGYQGLPQTGTSPLVHYEVAVVEHTSRVHEYYGAQCNAPHIHAPGLLLTVYS